MRKIAKRWGEMLSIFVGLLCLVGGAFLPIPQRDQLVEVSGILHDKSYWHGRRMSQKLYFNIDEHKYSTDYYAKFINDNVKNGTQVRVFWNPQYSDTTRDVAELWVGDRLFLSFKAYKGITERNRMWLLIIGAIFLPLGVLWWVFREKPLIEID